MISDADRLLARGAPITLQDQALRVHFGMASLLYLEKEYGGLDVFWGKLSESGFGASRINTIYNGMVAGLLETTELDIPEFKAELMKRLDPKDLLKYLEAVVIAFSESIPGFETSPTPKAKGSRANSPGLSSITPRRSRSGAQTASSGA